MPTQLEPITGNPLLDEAIKADPNVDMGDTWERPDVGVEGTRARRELTKRYAWAIPNDAALDAISALSPIVEIGAGTGYWAALVAERGADVVAYDSDPYRNHWCDGGPYHPVHVGGAEKVAGHPDRTLFLCWPPMSSMATDCLREYEGRALVYVGEPFGGCCADDEFFDTLGEEWREVRQIDIPTWWGLHDRLWIYERREVG